MQLRFAYFTDVYATRHTVYTAFKSRQLLCEKINSNHDHLVDAYVAVQCFCAIFRMCIPFSNFQNIAVVLGTL